MTSEGAVALSVIVPVYNVGAFLQPLLDSLSAQAGQSMEFIAVNDGSTDGSDAVLRAHAAKEPRLRIVDKPNGGLSSARNAGLRAARGQWLAFADGDDWVAPGTYAAWLAQARAEKLDLLIGNAFRFAGPAPTAAAGAPMLTAQPAQVTSGRGWIVHCVACNEWPHYVFLQLVNRRLLASGPNGFKEGVVHEDILWTLNLALGAQRVGFASAPRYGYRENPASITGNVSEAASLRRAESYLHIIEALARAAADAHEPALRDALQRQAHREARHLFGLMRKRIGDPSVRVRIARAFRAQRIGRIVWRGARSSREWWFALRINLYFRRQPR